MTTLEQAARQALGTLEIAEGAFAFGHIGFVKMIKSSIADLRQALEQQNQFNPDWNTQAVLVEDMQRMAKRIEELEAATPQPARKWVGLADEEISAISKKLFGSTYDAGSDRHFARAIEAKLKELNT